MPKCKVCKNKFEPKFSSFQKVCFNAECVLKYREIEKKNDFDKWAKTTKEKHKTHGDYENELQTEVNTIARLIDKGHRCISHNGPCKTTDAGHYHSVGSSNNVRFNLFNLWGQCDSCNRRKGSNRTGYDDGLKEQFGHDVWIYINESMRLEYKEVKLTIPELKDAILQAKTIVKELLKNDIYNNNEVRLQLREKYNKQLKIYTNDTNFTRQRVH